MGNKQDTAQWAIKQLHIIESELCGKYTSLEMHQAVTNLSKARMEIEQFISNGSRQ